MSLATNTLLAWHAPFTPGLACMTTRTSSARAIQRLYYFVLLLYVTSKGITNFNVLALELVLVRGWMSVSTWIPSSKFATTAETDKILLLDVVRPFVAVQMLLALVSSIAARKLTPKRVECGRARGTLEELDFAAKFFHRCKAGPDSHTQWYNNTGSLSKQ